MARNVEIKARARHFADQQSLAQELGNDQPVILEQVDTFFNVDSGRLKLREFPDTNSQLIFYRRNDTLGPKLSDYHITETADGNGLKSVLEKAYGIRQVVSKTRYLYLHGQTRIHFDRVHTLGDFIELEVVLRAEQSQHDGQVEAQRLMSKLGIHATDLIDVAYVDLLEQVA